MSSIVSVEIEGELLTRGVRLPRENRKFWQSKVIRRYEVVESIGVWLHTSNSRRYYKLIPAGALTDFASTPWVARLLFPQSLPGSNVAFVVHDALYADNEVRQMNGSGIYLPKHACDQAMRCILLDTDTAAWRANSMYTAVKYGAWPTWRRCRNQQRADQ